MKLLGLAAVALYAQCGGPSAPSDTCGASTACSSGSASYSFCTAGTTCKYKASDGSTYACASCSDCAGASSAITTWCAPGSAPAGGLPDFSAGQTYGIDLEAPALVSAGVQAGYSITASGGGFYRVVWTGDGGATGTFHEFSGTVWTTDVFATVTPGCANQLCPLEAGDTVSQPKLVTGGEVVTFDAQTSTGLDGFDFSIADEPIYFDLLIDGQRHPELVFLTSGSATEIPTTDPFAIETN